MSSTGFYLMHRGWQDHPVFRGEEFSRRDAFVWMIEEASYRDRRVAMPKGEVTLTRGQFSHSLRFMAKAWKWDEAKVRRFLTSLSKSQIIDASTDAGQTLVTICNYVKYQTLQEQPDAPTDAGATQQRRGNDANENEGNKGNEVKTGAKAPVGARARSSSPEFSRLPDDWTPTRFSDGSAARAVTDRRGSEWAKLQLEDFKAWAANAENKPGKGMKVDWQLAFGKWINEQDRKEPTHGRPTRERSAQPDLRGPRPDPALDMLRASRRAEAEEGAPGSGQDHRGTGLALPSDRSDRP